MAQETFILILISGVTLLIGIVASKNKKKWKKKESEYLNKIRELTEKLTGDK